MGEGAGAAAATAAVGWDAPLLAPQVRRGAQATQHSYGLTEVSAMLAELVLHRPGARVRVIKAEAAAVLHLHHLRRRVSKPGIAGVCQRCRV